MYSLDQVIYFLEQRQQTEDWNIRDAEIAYLKGYREVLLEYAQMKLDAVTNEPLTWEDLCKLDMIGSPVWNGSTCRWMLLIDSANDGTWIEMINHAGGHEKWIEHDLRKNPLYRKER